MPTGSRPHRWQRLGAYAVVTQGRRLLLTRISELGFPAGHWALPGGRVEHGESPWDALGRELFEETGLRVRNAVLWDVHSLHVVGDGRDGAVEDYHGVHILFTVETDPGEPHVVEVDGTSDAVEWVAFDDIADLPTLPVVEHVLRRLRD